MWGSAVVYFGLTIAVAGLALAIKPVPRLRVTSRWRGLLVAALGLIVVAVGLRLPVTESRIDIPTTRFDAFMPAWQFQEVHRLHVAAPPARVFDAIKRVRADEIALFNTLTWIRRGGRQAPPSILNAGSQDAILDVATRSGFVLLADEAPRELVIGTVVIAPAGTRGKLTSEVFQRPLPPGFALAVMNFLVEADGPERSWVSTETRVFANSDDARRRFAAYWRLIYPGSAIIRRMWLRAIERRATVLQSH
jgi:hypothetical protein